MRHLAPAFALGALRRGAEIEQFLGPVVVDGVAAIRWVSVHPAGDGYRVCLHTVAATGDETGFDLANYPPLDPEEYPGEGRTVGRRGDPAEAIALAESQPGVDPASWVNQSLAGDEYADFLRRR